MVSSRIADHVGRVLGGRYRLLAPVGTGASAHVFVADDVVLRRRVAVKVLHAALAEDEAFLRRFRAEARSAAGLNHPNIMRVFDWGEDDDGPFLVL
ncbi:MAG: serine/threonine protein kinase, partial [Actinobacteria bacterium]|nr:serine/threonine protein kinase [Actinomycetota bacterium]